MLFVSQYSHISLQNNNNQQHKLGKTRIYCCIVNIYCVLLTSLFYPLCYIKSIDFEHFIKFLS
nr:MAG TPA: hypothetical protein [Bacteriophage sp.]